MQRRSRFTLTNNLMPINDLLHAVVIAGALILSTLGLADELFNLRSERVLAVTAYALAVAGVTYASVLAQATRAAVREALRRRRLELATI